MKPCDFTATRNYEHAMEILEAYLTENGRSGFAYYTFPKGVLDEEKQVLNFDGYPAKATLRGPSFLKLAEKLYMSERVHENDPTMIESCLRNAPFNTEDVYKTVGREARKHLVFKILKKFNILNDVYIPLHTAQRYQVFWIFTLGKPDEDNAYTTGDVLGLKTICQDFLLAVSDYIIMEIDGILDSPLTLREQQCLLLVARGLSNDDIAVDLDISSRTAKFHIDNLMQKLNATSRTHAVAIAAKAGWLTN